MVAATGIELSATVLSLFVVAFCALQLSARCLSLRALFCLNLLALLHRCYMERLRDMRSLMLSCCRFLAIFYHILGVICFIASKLFVLECRIQVAIAQVRLWKECLLHSSSFA